MDGVDYIFHAAALKQVPSCEFYPMEAVRTNILGTDNVITAAVENKVEKVVKYFDVIQSVDSLKVAKAISAAACSNKKREKILLQVNNAGEEQKSGYTKEQLKRDLPEIISLEGVEVIGLMSMAPLGAGKEKLKKLFGDVREFRNELQREFNISLPELSMGMSDDYIEAAEEGATIIRIGRKLFT